MIDVISSTLSDQNVAYMSCTFLENLASKRAADVQQYDNRIIDLMQADSVLSSVTCSLLAKLATDEVCIAFYDVRRCLPPPRRFRLCLGWLVCLSKLLEKFVSYG